MLLIRQSASSNLQLLKIQAYFLKATETNLVNSNGGVPQACHVAATVQCLPQSTVHEKVVKLGKVAKSL